MRPNYHKLLRDSSSMTMGTNTPPSGQKYQYENRQIKKKVFPDIHCKIVLLEKMACV